MLGRLNRLIIVLLIVSAALYIVMLNRENISVYLSPSNVITTSAGVVFIAVFCLGILCTALVALFFGLKSWWREQGLHARERQRKAFLDTMVKARSLQAAGEWQQAALEWQNVLKRDPTSIIARLELSRCFETGGDLRESSKVVDAARIADPQNIEVLFRAAELNLALGNKTAAIDNLALVLYHHPVRKAAVMARDLSEDLSRFDDALQYQAEVEKLSGASDEDEEVRARLQLKKIERETDSDPQALRERVLKLAKQYKRFAPALVKLAQVEKQAGNIEEAAQYLVKAANLSTDPALWRDAVRFWTENRMPERALAAARSATKESHGLARLQAELDLILVYLSLQMHAEARAAIDRFAALAGEQGVEIESEMQVRLMTLKGLCLHGLGQFKESSEVWRSLAESDRGLAPSLARIKGPPSTVPPELSTP